MTELSAESFRPHLGTSFTIVGTGSGLVLVKLHELASEPGRRPPFTLTFTGETELRQGTYELAHEDMGRLDLFLVPRQPLPDGLPRYDAVFN